MVRRTADAEAADVLESFLRKVRGIKGVVDWKNFMAVLSQDGDASETLRKVFPTNGDAALYGLVMASLQAASVHDTKMDALYRTISCDGETVLARLEAASNILHADQRTVRRWSDGGLAVFARWLLDESKLQGPMGLLRLDAHVQLDPETLVLSMDICVTTRIGCDSPSLIAFVEEWAGEAQELPTLSLLPQNVTEADDSWRTDYMLVLPVERESGEILASVLLMLETLMHPDIAIYPSRLPEDGRIAFKTYAQTLTVLYRPSK